jgi:hypothetical protein
MAKRLTDSLKWDDPWFMELSAEHKIFWLYILDACDHAGVWEVNFRLAEFKTGIRFVKSELEETFSGRLHFINEKYWFILKFIDFQYNGIKNDNVGKSVQAIVHKYKLWGLVGAVEGLVSPLAGSKVKDIDKDNDIDKEIDKEKSSEKKVDQFPDMAFVQAMELNEMEVERVGVYVGQKFTLLGLREYWKAFSAKFDGSKFYQDRWQIISYFMNWLKGELKKKPKAGKSERTWDDLYREINEKEARA